MDEPKLDPMGPAVDAMRPMSLARSCTEGQLRHDDRRLVPRPGLRACPLHSFPRASTRAWALVMHPRVERSRYRVRLGLCEDSTCAPMKCTVVLRFCAVFAAAPVPSPLREIREGRSWGDS